MGTQARVVDDSGHFVPLREYVESIFAEREKLAETQRATLDRALVEARNSTSSALLEAKVAADAVAQGLTKRLELLESGGAPFASRLDQSLTSLKTDVDTLKENMVRTTVLDALREQTVSETKAQKRQIRYIAIAAGASFFVSLLLAAVELASGR